MKEWLEHDFVRSKLVVGLIEITLDAENDLCDENDFL